MKTAHKQILALLLALALLLSLCACAQKTQPESDEPKMSTDKVDFPTKADKKNAGETAGRSDIAERYAQSHVTK